MAKPELRDHRKFLKLKRLLGAPTPHVIGYLECLWLRGYQTGSPVIGDDMDVESAAEFPGEIGTFTKAALDAGFIDCDEAGVYTIHDLFEHAPSYAKKRMKRRGTDQKPSRTDKKPPKTLPRGSENTEKPPARRTEPRTKNLEPRTETKTLPADAGESRPRNELFDAVADVTGADPKGNGGEIATACKRLKEYDPPATAAEVREFGVRFWEICPWASKENRQRPTPMELAKWFNGVRAKPPPKQLVPAGRQPQSRGQAELDFAARMAADAFGASQ